MPWQQAGRDFRNLALGPNALLYEVLDERRFLHVGQHFARPAAQHVSCRAGAGFGFAAAGLGFAKLVGQFAKLLLV